MTFDPSVLGMITTSESGRNETLFTRSTNLLTITSDGLPSPARVDITNIPKQNFNFTFHYRAGENTQYPQETAVDLLGMFANGVPFKHNLATKRLAGNTTLPPVALTFNKVYFEDRYGADSDSGIIESNDGGPGEYVYKTGKFLSNGWDYPNVWGSKAYYADSNFNGDHYRHPNGHSKILGYCFDGYPIYGPYGYATGNDSNEQIQLIKSSYRVAENDSHRNPNWKYTDVLSTDIGDVVLGPGAFIEDFTYAKSKSTLDEFNGRFTKTPDFPDGTYAYFLTFEDDTLSIPAYPYIVGKSTKQQRKFDTAIPRENIVSGDLWTVNSGSKLTTLIERNVVDVPLPVINREGITTTLISGEIPTGLRFDGNRLIGTVYEVAYNKRFVGVIRAAYQSDFDDITIEIDVAGPDDPEWQTQQGLLPVGPNNTFYILDSEVINFQLLATDTDLPAGDTLTYYIADGDGQLPPGITLSEDGKLTGVTEPLLSLDKRFEGGGYDDVPYSALPMDYASVGSYYGSREDSTITPDSNLIKLNRYYPFAVTVTDGDTFVRREFRIYVVGDDYLKADNTLMESGTTLFNADATNVRNPTWITPRDLGYRRANNYTTIYLDVIQNPTLEGALTYSLEDLNDDGSVCELPKGLNLDTKTGELYGNIPYQPAILQDYKFTVRATRRVSDLETVSIFGTYYEDTLLGKNSFKIYKTNLTGDLDGVNDLFELVGKQILLEGNLYKVTSVDDRNKEYDTIVLDTTLAPKINLLSSRTVTSGSDHFFVSRLTESQKGTYQNRTLKYTETESYTITDITPYIEYNIRQSVPANNDIYPANAPKIMTNFENYYVGDYAIWPLTSGGTGRIFKCTTAHAITPLVDSNNVNILNDAGDPQITFIQDNWIEVAENLEALSLTDRLAATRQALEQEYGNTSYVRVVSPQIWNIRIPSTNKSRIITNIKEFFVGSDSTEFTVELVRDNEDRLLFDKNLTRQIQGGQNVGIALFKNQAFSKDLIVSSEDPVNIPSSAKTFEIKILGEVDTEIKWVTPSNLGKIFANFNSTLRVIAQSTVPDSKMVYKIIDGKLPNGLRLSYSGEIIGSARQFGDLNNLGLTTFENKLVTWDGKLPGDTTFDRSYKFTVEAKDRFNISAITQEFKLKVEDLDNTQYTDIVARPLLAKDQRQLWIDFIGNTDVFEPEKIFRPEDPKFGVQEIIEMLVYAGIEATTIDKFVAAAAKNHKRKKYILGEFKNAVAKDPKTGEVIYEVVYIDVIDPADAKIGNTRSSFRINTQKKITVDSIQYAGKDDNTKTGLGIDELPVYGRQITKFVFAENDTLVIETRDDGEIGVNVDNSDFQVEIRNLSDFVVKLQQTPSEPYRLRPQPTNTIKADSDAVKVSNAKDDIRYLSNIDNMRTNINQIGKYDRNYLPLWMRTPQTGLQELDYVSAIPVCYTMPGRSDDIIRNIANNGFNPKQIDFDIDRYVIKRTKDSDLEKYILFANYQFNV